MKLAFYKYHGTGNDFIIIDNRKAAIKLNEHQIKKLCSRRFGIGADGLMLLSYHHQLDFEMMYYNADGKEGSMCGNGGRCIIAFAKKLGLIDNSTSFMAIDGIHHGKIIDNIVDIAMNDVNAIDFVNNNYFLDTGSPHLVTFVQDVKHYEVYSKGEAIRYSNDFAPSGTNVNFVEYLGENNLFVRTYERGVENETYSCGTGAVASAIAAVLQFSLTSNVVNIDTPGGKLTVCYDLSETDKGKSFSNIVLNGPTKFVYIGDIEL